jgi:hypothetical protein
MFLFLRVVATAQHLNCCFFASRTQENVNLPLNMDAREQGNSEAHDLGQVGNFIPEASTKG